MANRPVLLVASQGGHWVQLRQLAVAFADCQVVYVSTSASVSVEVAPARLAVVPDANLQARWQLLRLAWRMAWVVLRFRPSHVVSTGAAPGFFALAFGKLVGAQTVWVDSIANAEQLSVSGRHVRRFADLWLTQWPHLAKPQGPFYRGALL